MTRPTATRSGFSANESSGHVEHNDSEKGGQPVTLPQFMTLTEAYDRVDVRRAMVAVLARERPRSVEGYRRFYCAVSLRLLPNSPRASVPFGLQDEAMRHLGDGHVKGKVVISSVLRGMGSGRVSDRWGHGPSAPRPRVTAPTPPLSVRARGRILRANVNGL